MCAEKGGTRHNLDDSLPSLNGSNVVKAADRLNHFFGAHLQLDSAMAEVSGEFSSRAAFSWLQSKLIL